MEEDNPIQPQQPVTQPQPLKKPFFSKTIIAVFVIAIILILLPVGAYLFLNSNKQVACTTEAKLCPDGTYVSRTGPKCEFTACPSNPRLNWKTYIDNDYNFSFAYPPALNVQKKQPNPIGAEILIYDPKIGTKSGAMAGINVYHEFFALYLPEYITFDNLYASPSGSIINMYSKVFGNYQLTKNENRLVDGKKAFYYTRIPLPIDTKEPGTGKGLYVKFADDLVAAIESPENKFSDLKLILSTLKFNNQVSPTPTCRPRPACLDATPRCMIPETSDMCPSTRK